jgi:hypothetical protein
MAAALRPASRRVIAEIASEMKHDHIVAEFEKLELLADQQEYNDILNGMEGGISMQGKEAQLKAMLDWVANDEERDKKLIPLAENLVSKALRGRSNARPEAKRLNLFLMGDGKAYNSRTETISDAIGRIKVERKLSAELDRRLADIDEKLVEVHDGMWDALASDSKDSERHASSSSRGLLQQVLEKLTSDLVAEKGKEISINRRVRHIFKSENDAELVNAMVKAAQRIYGATSKGVHSKADYDPVVIAAKMTEYVLLFILRRAQSS